MVQEGLDKLATSLIIHYIKNRAKLLAFEIGTLSTINVILQSCGESVTTHVAKHEPAVVIPDKKCHICLKNPHDLEDEERHRRKANLNKINANVNTVKN